MTTNSIRTLLGTLFLCLSACSKPDFTTVNGDSGQFAQGQWQFINYWATWCGPCRDEIPELNDFAKNHADIRIYGINYDGLEGDALTAAIADMGIEFSSLSADPAPTFGIPRPQVLPTTLVISPDGKLVASLMGPQTAQTLGAAIEAAKQKSNSANQAF